MIKIWSIDKKENMINLLLNIPKARQHVKPLFQLRKSLLKIMELDQLWHSTSNDMKFI